MAQKRLTLAAIAIAACVESPPQGTWSAAPSMPVERFEGASVSVGSLVYYIGGISGTFGDQMSARESNRVDILETVTGTWSLGPPLPDGAPMHHLAVATIADRIYVLGGFNGIIGGADAAGVFVANGRTYVLEQGAWRRLADQPFARGSATAQPIDGKIYVAGGGITEPDARADFYVYDPTNDAWSALPRMPTAREHVASCALAHRMIVLGGWVGPDKSVVATAEEYDTRQNVWTVLPDMPTARGGLGADTIAGTCFAVGGETWTGDLPGTFASVEAFDGSEWSTRADLPTARHGLGVTVTQGALYAVAGGPIRGNSYTSVIEVFRP